MRQEFSDRLKILRKERVTGSWRDGWIYGRLKQEFDLQPDELNTMATVLGFKYGWNPMVKNILENQWQEDEVRWMQQEANKIQKQASLKRQKYTLSQKIAVLLREVETVAKPRQELTDIERVLIAQIIKMEVDEQVWMLEMILDRRKEKTLLDGVQI
ncbi:hypothetical protein IQ260_04585 [Leptolyngbya cf. ectocarpi LEGE 11479]|uniref:Uncharacterized protein n=1 Tax=Leptolyngbya cf. ectocarpi LEGE 11479 TaxID=1828722 RepID=A0A928ZQX8_LEPEC|nr:hypothetical protein [Leptolyngbya ectocarpi]MBE9065923.1 hypothetical protein [Leptolyngbya cf. ectocarpi LEGE 11479]